VLFVQVLQNTKMLNIWWEVCGADEV